MVKDLSFRSINRLKGKKNFSGVRRRGRRYKGRGFTVYILDNDLGTSRLGLAVNRKTGTSVERNRFKRLIREYFRLNLKELSKDIFLVPRDISSFKTLKKTEEALSFIKEGLF